MSDYISREAVKRVVCIECGLVDNCDEKESCCAIGKINAILAADVVEVVRCKDCIHAIPRSEIAIERGWSPFYCDLFVFAVEPEFFCFAGEREAEFYCPNCGAKMDGEVQDDQR